MRKQRQRRIRQQAQAILFCSILVWMAASFIAAVPAMAFQPQQSPDVLTDYEDVATYQDYAYASSASGEEAVSHKVGGKWEMVCQSDRLFTGFELIEKCSIPIGTARHLKVLKHKGMSHQMFVAGI
ncbi:MAG: hypothetical protein DCF25_02325 [Leptolyngbya foveolarum]|uniref:Uncharacterized protein n=1 Tax=Leptolyngbya foveolarum TaxID=47253 RepID=A0A2W4V0J5_9CYAN|nr:MAG: hypothetical protein DCF25_02325 [Leptolyngbya foveolarum]